MRAIVSNLGRNISKTGVFSSKVDYDLDFATKCIHSGYEIDPFSGAVNVPIYQTSTYEQRTPGTNYEADCIYTRTRNPTRSVLQDCLCDLEGADHCYVASSGLGATIGILTALLQEGDHVISVDCVYGGTREQMERIIGKLGVDFTFMDLNGEEFENSFNENTKLVWLETPTNPTLKCSDIERVSKIAHDNDCIVVVDNTFMSPYLQNPLEKGADVVLHSLTKYLNGHADILGGAALTNDPEIAEQIFFTHENVGATSSPFDCYLCLRGIKTLPLRMEKHQENAEKVAEYLEQHPKVEKVLYPGLKSHPDYEIHQNNARGGGGMIAMYLQGGMEESRRFLEALDVWTLAVSLGGVESLAEHAGLMTHKHMSPEERKILFIDDNMIRLSVGIENIDDLIRDLENALEQV